MTMQEFGTVSRFAAILLFGFLVPTSTGNDFFVAPTAPQQQTAGSHSSESTKGNDAFLNMSLEERLEKSCRFYTQGEFGEVNSIVDANRQRAFQSFLHNGIGPFLAARQAHSTESTDLLHLLAMAIHPQPQQELIPLTSQVLSSEKDSSFWTRTQRFMACIHAGSFQVNESHRLVLVKMMADKLVLPQQHQQRSTTFADDPLQDGPVPHLRAALHSFALGESAENAQEANRALVNIAVRTGDETTVAEEWNALFKSTVNNVTECKCNDYTFSSTKASRKRPFCTHVTRGKLMQQFILDYNESRYYADAAFTRQALESLSTCLQQQSTTTLQPCLVASLLMAARSLFYFLLPETTGQDDNDTAGARDKLIRAAIQLLHHPAIRVSKASSSLLALAFAYNSSELTMAYIEGVEKSIQRALDPCFGNDNENSKGDSVEERFGALQDVTITLSRLLPTFASVMLEHFLTKLQQGNAASNAAACRMIAAIATARPFAAQKQVESILSLAKTTQNNAACQSQLVSTLLTLRQAHLFAKDTREDVRLATTELLSNMTDQWILYKLACHALVTGNNNVARDAFESLLASSSSESTFLWMSALSNVAKGKDELASKGCHGILTATPPFYSAVSYLESLADSALGNEFGFQIEYLQLRIDLLEQCTSLYSLCREIRLSGAVPKATVRTGLHLRNTLKLFYALAGRYYSLYKRYGLFICQQSRTALRTCHALCRWLGDAGRKAFPEVKMEKIGDETAWPHGDELHPLTLLLKKLNKVVVDPMQGSFDPQLRAAAIAETLDAILMAPYPFPRGFTTVQSIPSATLRLANDRNETDDATCEFQDLEEAITLYPGATCTLLATGEIPSALFQKAKVSFSQILLWQTDRYVGLLNDDDDDEAEDGNERDSSISTLTKAQDVDAGPMAIPLLPSGRYLAQIQYQAPVDEGLYSVEIVLGCRDVRCGEWELPVELKSRTVLVRVSRSSA